MLRLKLWSVAVGIAAALGVTGTAQAQQCNCANATLIGDTVSTQISVPSGAWPVATSVVGGNVEISNSQTQLGYITNRFNVDYGANTIKMYWNPSPVSPADYIGASTPPLKIAFTNLDPSPPAGCTGTPFIASINVTTNTGYAFISAGATFTANSVTIPFSQSSGATTYNSGDYILVTLSYACSGGGTTSPQVDCCGPLTQPSFTSMLSEDDMGGIMDPYVIKFEGSATSGANSTFNAQMQAFYNYVHLMDPTIVNVDVFLLLYNCNTNGAPSNTPCAGGTLMNNIKVLSWNSLTSSGTPITGEIIPPYTPGTWGPVSATQVFDNATQQLSVNNLYQVVAVMAFDRPSLGANRVEFLDQKCGVFIHQANHMQSQKLANTVVMTAGELGRTKAGQLVLRQLRDLSSLKANVRDGRR